MQAATKEHDGILPRLVSPALAHSFHAQRRRGLARSRQPARRALRDLARSERINAAGHEVRASANAGSPGFLTVGVMQLGRPPTTPTNDPGTGASNESRPPNRAEEVMRTPESVEFMDVEVLKDIGLTLVCLVNGKRVSVPMLEALAGSAMRWGRKRGKLVIRRELAVELGLL